MKCEIITIGDEILIGQIIDTNSAWIGQQFNANGIQICRIVSIQDSAEEIRHAVTEALGRADLVLTTGGLGPTKDDITKHTLCSLFETRLVRNAEVEAKLEDWFNRRGRTLSEMNRAQADLPEACEVLPNAMGTASGMWFDRGNSVLVSLPGVPYEMKHLVEAQVLPRIRSRYTLPNIYHKTLMTAGIVESAIAEKLKDFEERLPAWIKLAYLPKPGIVRLRLSAYGQRGDLTQMQAKLDEQAAEIRSILGYYVYGEGDEGLAFAIGQALKAKNATVSTAESCTGGRIAALLNEFPGSSAWYRGSIVAYHNEVKESLLAVDPEVLKVHGAVSRETVEQMAVAAQKQLGSTYAIASSGVAGPDGGSEEKPVGTVCLAIADAKGVYSARFSFGDQRGLITERASQHALFLLWKLLASGSLEMA